MTRTQVNLAAVGGFVALGLVSLIVVLAVLAGRTGATDVYYTTFPNVAGLKFGALVQYEGYAIGQVEKLIPEPDAGRMQFRVELSVIEGWRIPSDSVASIAVSGLLAPASIAIKAGQSDAALQPGERIQPGVAAGLFAGISGVGEQVGKISDEGLLPVLRNLDRQLSRIGVLLDGDVGQAMRHIRSLAAQFDQAAPVVIADLQSFTADLSQTGSQLATVLTPQRLAELDQVLIEAANTAISLNSSAQRISQLVDEGGGDLDAAAKDLRYAMAAIAQRIDSFSHNLDAASRDLAEFSRQVRQDPSRVLRATRPGAEPQP